MQATVGAHITVHGKSVGDTARHGSIIEVRGTDGKPPYLVRFDDGHESLVFPGPDFSIETHAAH